MRRLTLTLLAALPLAAQYRVHLASEPQPLTLSPEHYVAAALAGEAGGFTSPEALRAMAITIRTFARVNANRHRAQGFDFCATTHCQKLLLHDIPARLQQAADDTEGLILTANARPAEVFYSRHCGGRRESAAALWPDAARPWLRGGEDSFCLSASRLPWRARLPLADLARALNLPSITQLAVARRTASGRAALLHTGRAPLDAETFHLAVGRALGWDHLRGKLYDVHTDHRFAYFEGSGAGHGVGLCQTGAEERGKAGHSAAQILAAYFPGTKIHHPVPWRPLHSESLDIHGSGAHGESQVPALAERALREAERLAGRPLPARPALRIYSSLAAFRDTTGEPGFVAASTRGRTIRLQPPARFLAERRLHSLLLHEFLHLALAPSPGVRLPLWFQEGLPLWLEQPSTPPAPLDPRTEARLARPRSEAELRAAYANARAAVAALAARHGRAAVLAMPRTGLR